MDAKALRRGLAGDRAAIWKGTDSFAQTALPRCEAVTIFVPGAPTRRIEPVGAGFVIHHVEHGLTSRGILIDPAICVRRCP